MFLEEISIGLSPITGIEHQIDSVPRAIIRNRLPYRSNPEETNEIQRQVMELMSKRYVRESMTMCNTSAISTKKG